MTTTSVALMMGMGVLLVVFFFLAAGIQPLKVLRVLDGNVTIFDDDHEDVLYERNQEEEEAVHEQVGVDKVAVAHGSVGIVERIACLQGKDGEEALTCTSK